MPKLEQDYTFMLEFKDNIHFNLVKQLHYLSGVELNSLDLTRSQFIEGIFSIENEFAYISYTIQCHIEEF